MLNHSGTQTLQSKRLTLRQFTIDDTEAAFNNWCNDDAVTRFLTWPTHDSTEVTKCVLNDWIVSYKNKDFYQWAIVLNEIDEPIGSISIIAYDDTTDTVEVGYCIGRSWWHKGIMTEAFTCLIDYLFNEIKVNRIQAKHDMRNPHSGQVMMKCGLTYEGTLRQAALCNQGLSDVSVYSLLRSEWEKK